MGGGGGGRCPMNRLAGCFEKGRGMWSPVHVHRD